MKGVARQHTRALFGRKAKKVLPNLRACVHIFACLYLCILVAAYVNANICHAGKQVGAHECGGGSFGFIAALCATDVPF